MHTQKYHTLGQTKNACNGVFSSTRAQLLLRWPRNVQGGSKKVSC